MKHGKKYREAFEKVDVDKVYGIQEGVDLVKAMSFVKFDETVEVSVNLNIKKSQSIRDTFVLPHQFAAEKRVLVFAKGDKAKEAEEAGAAYVGAEDLVEKIKGGWLDFDVAVATPDMMKVVGRLGKILGARGLMPNPKSGTVTMDLERTVKELKAGRIEYRVDRQANVAVPIGKVSFSEDNLIENFRTFVDALLKAKPATAKGAYMKGLSICSTMGIGIKLDHQAILADLKK